MNYRCPVCFYDRMQYPPENYNICPCCGTEFGNDDVEYGYSELRYNWVINGAGWFFGQPPAGWSAAAQLAKVAYGLHTDVSAGPLNTTVIRGSHELELQLA